MKQYGSFKATEFSPKQISVIYRLAKNSELIVEKWFMSELYTLADYYGYDDNGSVADSERDVKTILENVFSGKLSEAQQLICAAEDSWYSSYGKKTQAKCDRTAFVA